MKLLTPIKRIIRKADANFNKLYRIEEIMQEKIRSEMLLFSALQSKETGVSESGTPVIISLTTYNKRIYDVHLTIETLLLQTLKPQKIVLWLDENEFSDTTIPELLKKQQQRGLKIGYCKNLKSYKKLIPTLEKYPNETIITADDDILYPLDMVENLWREHLKTPDIVVCCRAHKMLLDKYDKLLPYNSWLMDYTGIKASKLIFPTGNGGVLYPSGCFHKDILREDLFLKLAPQADDVWFKAMTLLNDTPCRKINSSPMMMSDKNQDIGLCKYNCEQGGNDLQILQTFNYYNLWEKLKK